MSDQKLVALKKLIVGLAAYYGHAIDEFVVGMYAEDLADLPIEDVLRAAREIRFDPKNTKFPLPAVIREKAAPNLNDTDVARDVAARILKAVGRHGHNWSDKDPAWPSEPLDQLGELGYEVVKRLGGWMRVCEFSGEVGSGIFMAQIRDLADATMKAARAGNLEQAPSLPAPKTARSTLGPIPMRALLSHVQASEPKDREDGEGEC
jgi:hypothetical protein